MADTKLTDLSAIGTPTTDDLLYVVDDPAGTPASKKMTIAQVITLAHPTAALASIPAAVAAGRIFLPSDGVALYRDTGAAHAGWGPLFPLTDPTLQTWSWDNQQSASVDTSKGGINLIAPALAGDQLHVRYHTAPATPYTVTALLLATVVTTVSGFGIAFRESGTGKLVILDLTNAAGAIEKWTSATAISAGYQSFNKTYTGGPIFLQITDNGTNLLFKISTDGIYFVQLHSVSRTDFMAGGPDQVGFYANIASASWTMGVTVLSWKIT